MDSRTPLFSTINAMTLQQQLRQRMASAIAGMPGDQLLRSNIEDLMSYFVEVHRIDVLRLDEADMTIDQRESTRDVSDDPMRMAYALGRGPVYVTGTEVTVEVPFTGDPEMFTVQPSRFDFNPPRGHVQGNKLFFTSWSDSPHPERLRAELHKWIDDVKRYLQWLDGTFLGFNGALENEARAAVQQCWQTGK